MQNFAPNPIAQADPSAFSVQHSAPVPVTANKDERFLDLSSAFVPALEPPEVPPVAIITIAFDS